MGFSVKELMISFDKKYKVLNRPTLQKKGKVESPQKNKKKLSELEMKTHPNILTKSDYILQKIRPFLLFYNPMSLINPFCTQGRI